MGDMGEKAHVAVNDHGKAASAHDLRRSFGQRMANAQVAVLQKMMPHAFKTTEQFYLRDEVQEAARQLGIYLGTVEGTAKTKAEQGST